MRDASLIFQDRLYVYPECRLILLATGDVVTLPVAWEKPPSVGGFLWPHRLLSNRCLCGRKPPRRGVRRLSPNHIFAELILSRTASGMISP